MSWTREKFQGMPGYDTQVDQCAYGLIARDRDGNRIGPMKKATQVRTTKWEMYHGLWRKCHCSEPRVPREGNHIRGSENYPMQMAFTAARLIQVRPEGDVYAVDDVEDDFTRVEFKDLMEQLKQKFTLAEINWV